MASYADYLAKVEQILHEPLPESPGSSMCDWNEVGVDVALEMREKIPGTPIPGFTFFNDITLGLRPHEFTIGSGPTGCLGGETLIPINRAGKGFTLTIREIYLRTHGMAQNRNFEPEIPTMVRSFDGVGVRLHRMKDVFISGIKETRRYRFQGGKDLRLTADHRVLTRRGWVPAGQLTQDDLVAHDNKHSKATGMVRVRRYDPYVFGMKHHPFAGYHPDGKRLVIYRAIYEAHANGLSLEEFKHILKNDPGRAKTLKYVNPKTHHVHHVDHNYTNNSPDNLELLSIEEHRKHHADHANFNQGRINWVKFLGSDKPGVEAVYDIECEDPHHNFVANEIVVHNCGKTTLLCNWAYLLAKAGAPILIGSIETGKNDFHRVMAGVAGGVNPYAGHSKELITQIFQENPVLRSKQNVHLKYSSRVNHRRLLADILYAHETRGIQFAFIDNLNFLLDVREHKNEIQAVDTTIHDMVTFVKKVPVHIVMIMHPNKDGIQRVEHEGMIKGSTTAVQEAANIFVWNRLASDGDAAHNKEPSWCRELMFRKVRKNGRAVGTRIVYSIHDRAPILFEEKLL